MNNLTFRSTIRQYVNGSVVLVIATLAALLVANLPGTRDWYVWFCNIPVNLSIGNFQFFSHNGHPMSLSTFVNDFLMAVFFLSVGLEIKREVLCGELSSFRKALLPVIGACGGMLFPVIVYSLVGIGDKVMERGMAIPMATDIAFSLGIISIFNKRVPMGLKIFLAALAVVDDLGGIIVIAIRYTDSIDMDYLMLAGLMILILVIANYRGMRSKTFYLSIGLLLWYFVTGSGIHSTISGVILAFCIPANLGFGTKYYMENIRSIIKEYPVIEVTHEDRNKAFVMSDEDIQHLRGIEVASDHLISTLQDLEDGLKNFINYFVIPIFAFVNAGICFEGMSPMNLFSGVGLGVFLGLLVGKFTGVLSVSWLFMKLGVVEMPDGGNMKSFASVCMLCGIGFTVSMFIAELSFGPIGRADLLADAKLGIFGGTIASALLGCLMLHLTLPRAPHSAA